MTKAYFTYHYNQPDEYRFSLDSTQLAEFVASQLVSRNDLSSLRILDLCAGCGVIGFELSWHLQAIQHIDFVEVQDIYTNCFFENRSTVNRPECQFNWYLLNYDELHQTHWEAKYDLIISNPPYFQPGHGVLSPSQFKNRCRFYIDSSFENYIKAIANALADNGEAYFLLRPLDHHGFDLLLTIQEMLNSSKFHVQKISNIRGTDVILLKKVATLYSLLPPTGEGQGMRVV